jgi:hypothetical protein
VVVVVAGLLFEVDPWWWNKLGEPVRVEAGLPVAVVDHPVVVAAQQYEVVQGGGPAL